MEHTWRQAPSKSTVSSVFLGVQTLSVYDVSNFIPRPLLAGGNWQLH